VLTVGIDVCSGGMPGRTLYIAETPCCGIPYQTQGISACKKLRHWASGSPCRVYFHGQSVAEPVSLGVQPFKETSRPQSVCLPPGHNAGRCLNP
jgi:hypothetical protein